MRTYDLVLVAAAVFASAVAAAAAHALAESEGEADGDGRNLEVLHNPYRSRGASLVYKTFHHRDPIQ